MVSVAAPVHRLSVEDVFRMAEAGVLDEHDRVELVEGGYLLPDLALVVALPRSALPTTAHLVIEVAQTSQARDREKARDYAAAGVDEYWIVDLLARTVIVHRQPLPGAYQEITTFDDGASIKPLLADAPEVAVTELLG